MPPFSAEIGSRQSAGSTVNKPFILDTSIASPIPECPAHFPPNGTPTIVKVEKLNTIIELSSESERESPTLIPTLKLDPLQRALEENNPGLSASTTPYSTRLQPRISHSRLHGSPVPCISILECLKDLSNLHHSRNELSTMDLRTLTHQEVEFLPPTFNGDAIFELPPCRASSSSSAAKNLERMDKRSDGHTWCKLVTTNIPNLDNLKFRKSFCVGHLICENSECEYFKRAARKNETKWSGSIILPFVVGIIPPKDCKLVCKVCKTIPRCLNTCDARIYYCYSENPNMTRAAIHLGKHFHLVAKGTYRDSAKEISELIAKQVAKTPTATNSAIALSASKEFLTNHLFHHGEGEKQILKGEEMEEVMDRFQMLSSPSIRNVISSFRSNNRGGVIDNIMTMKRESKFEFIHDNVFPGQGKEKVYVFKMLTEGPGSGVDLMRRMQVGGDLQNAWMMFDHVKRVKDWTTMACHVYDSHYKKVMTIAICNMQSEDTEVHVQFWRSLNVVMSRHGVENPNFKGFMADSAMANWNVVCIVYGSGSADKVMENRERTCLLHWSNFLHKHTQKHIKQSLQ